MTIRSSKARLYSDILEKLLLSCSLISLLIAFFRAPSCLPSSPPNRDAIANVHSDISKVTDSSKLSLLVLLDLSAAFESINHNTLLRRLDISFGFEGTALEWLGDQRSFKVLLFSLFSFRGSLV